MNTRRRYVLHWSLRAARIGNALAEATSVRESIDWLLAASAWLLALAGCRFARLREWHRPPMSATRR
jgi:hypothetical protein